MRDEIRELRNRGYTWLQIGDALKRSPDYLRQLKDKPKHDLRAIRRLHEAGYAWQYIGKWMGINEGRGAPYPAEYVQRLLAKPEPKDKPKFSDMGDPKTLGQQLSEPIHRLTPSEARKLLDGTATPEERRELLRKAELLRRSITTT